MSKGTSQKERMTAALDPEAFKVDDRTPQDLLREAQEFAKVLAYYESSADKPDDDENWSPFLEDGLAFLKQSPVNKGECPPHLGLLIAFHKLFGYTQQQLNGLTTSHLQFFYKKILGQRNRKARPDQVFVFFELAKHIKTFVLPRETALLAGKDPQGNEILYSTDREASLGHAKLSHFKVVLSHKNLDKTINAYPFANSSDGLGEPLDDGQGWHPFGNHIVEESNSSDGLGAPLDDGQGWHPFENHKVDKSKATIGFGVSSPVLFLKKGVRVIQISISITGNIAPELSDLDSSAFEVLLTGVDGWFKMDVKELSYQDNKLIFLIQLNETDPEVAGFDKTKHIYELYDQKYPVLIFRLKQGFTYSLYALIQSLKFTKVIVKAEVKNVRSLLARNDYGELDTRKAFHPFGYRPVKGDNFYLGYKETFFKSLSTFSLKINWKGLPENFKNYYEGYMGHTNSLVTTNDDFKVKATIHYKNKWYPEKDEDIDEFPLFSDRLELDFSSENEKSYSNTFQRGLKYEDGLIRFTLSSPENAFGHLIYPKVYADSIRSQLQDEQVYIPNEPYTPFIESVELNYSSVEKAEGYFYVKPFGLEKIKIKNNPLISDEFRSAGNLYIGIEDLNPPQQLAIFFEIDEEIQEEKEDLSFYYQSDNGWQQFSENQILSDSTLGLNQTGILIINFPGDMSSDYPAMPSGSHWVRISVPDHTENFNRILNVRTNAVRCTLANAPIPVEFEINSLPPFSIQSLSEKIAEIKNVVQPYSSFGGRPAEKMIDYFIRVSEMLRHKMKGISVWDLERLILDQFPEIYKVWCLPHRNANGLTEPGSIHVIVIPFLQYHQSKVLKPSVSESTLTEIQNFTKNVSSSNVRIQVTNPAYVEIKVDACVSFSSQVDAGYSVNQLNLELQRLFSPWAFHDVTEINLGDRLYKSSIIEFIESREYVNYIASFSIKLLQKKGNVIEEEEINPSEHTLIVSSATHDIKAVDPEAVICQTNQGIDQMIVDINFEVQ